jgi:energy-coupling factor transport system substrate-specific component
MKNLNKLTIFLIPIGIAINVVGGQLALLLKLPVFLDCIGTIVVGALCGTWPGVLVGLGCGLINSISAPNLLPYTVIGMLFGFIGNLLAKKNMFDKIWKAPINGVCIALVSTCIAVPITATLYGGFVGTGASGIVAALMAAGWGVVPATFVSELSAELMDKLVCLIVIFFVLKAMPARLVVKLPNGKYFVNEEE